MAEQPHLNDELNELAEALAALKPVESRVNRDRLMYEAGRAAALAEQPAQRRSVRAWRYMTALSTAVAAGLAVAMVYRVPVANDASVAAQGPGDIAGEQSGNNGQTTTEPFDVVVDSEKLRLERVIRTMSVAGGELREPEYLRLRNLVLAGGIDKLPTASGHDDGSGTSDVPLRYEPLTSGDVLRPGRVDTLAPGWFAL